MVALTLSAGYGSGYAVGCGDMVLVQEGQKDAAEAAERQRRRLQPAAAGSDRTAEPAKASTADGEAILIGALCIP